ncbi:hypothetical protein [Dietzia sp. IN118]|uniref:hypothetical protein n=1 Tax=Dietzia sp. IN118 TaxID=3061631 RepID=UPI002939C817|nr:hypothetical protein [Dietzia sp. IN118]MDV3354476.1 hypothetical protein [Dietzia sp. IN118]
MTIEDLPDPVDYTPEPDSVTAAENNEPETSADDPTHEANPADVAEQMAALPEGDEELTDDEPESEAE